MNYLPKNKETIIGTMFFVSGFCSLLYQTLWLRLAFAKFGVITPVVSLVVSVFMLGLGLGSLCSGVYVTRLKRILGCSAIKLYGFTECFIGAGAFIVPFLFNIGANCCLAAGESDSWLNLLASAIIIVISILPFAFAMGATFPLALEFLKEDKKERKKAFGLLYAVNTAGAWLGCLIPVFVLIEILGFKLTLLVATFFNFAIGLVALIWSRQFAANIWQGLSEPTVEASGEQNWPTNKFRSMLILFITGFSFMAMEVVWTRSFTPILGNMVYSFASLLASYLASNWFGASLYRISLKNNRVMSLNSLLPWTALSAALPLLSSNPTLVQFFAKSQIASGDSRIPEVLIILSVMPLSALLGYLTPLILDDLSNGDPRLAGKAYAVNILGCVIGPLISGYLLLPWLGDRYSLLLLILPLVSLSLFAIHENKNTLSSLAGTVALVFGIFIMALAPLFLSWDEGGSIAADRNKTAVFRDYAATTIAYEEQGVSVLLVNGNSMTLLTPITRYMSHLPAAFLKTKPKSILVICFGMGTTFRSALAWDCKVTAVELVPGVVKAFTSFYPDALASMQNKNAHIVVDDGRRFLRRTNEKFDVIIVDPPPPITAATSSLLFSKEFFSLAKKHLNPGGILQEWAFPDENIFTRAMIRGLIQEFPYVRIYRATYDKPCLGFHVLASESPIPELNAQELYDKLPAQVIADLEEPLGQRKFDPKSQIAEIIANEKQVDKLLAKKEKPIVITDDRPYNEYYLMQLLLGREMSFGI